MNQEQMKARTKEFAKRVIYLCRELPRTQEGKLIGGQVFRSGTSVGANYRAACRGRSKADFMSKLGIALEEADETLFWLEILSETKGVKTEQMLPLMQEARADGNLYHHSQSEVIYRYLVRFSICNLKSEI